MEHVEGPSTARRPTGCGGPTPPQGASTEAGHYYRTSPVFRTDDPAHHWLAETVFVGLARPGGEGAVIIRMYALK
ncbi:DUF3237 domain-containing protein [Streptomyces sp. NBC_00090]|uniref:DUF3237 family protein n=1 Tax=Streptomyces sp. NBC_00090 TaxID=2903619 RepID=UPI003249DAD1